MLSKVTESLLQARGSHTEFGIQVPWHLYWLSIRADVEAACRAMPSIARV